MFEKVKGTYRAGIENSILTENLFEFGSRLAPDKINLHIQGKNGNNRKIK